MRLWTSCVISMICLGISTAKGQTLPPAPTDPQLRIEWAREQGEKLRAENGKRREVKTLASGLQYEILRSGPAAGAFPAAEDKVRVHYQGTFIDGTEFDSSYTRSQPATFPVNKVIKGWQEVLPLMRRGDIWHVWVPPELGYGRAGKGPIGGQETLIFKIELLEINPKGP